MPRYSSIQRQRSEEERHRREILEAAIGVFAERGFHAATIRDVARSARFSVGKLYLHFHSKEALYAALLDHYVDQVIELLEGVFAAAGSARDRLERAVRAALAFHDQNPLFLRLFVNETLGFELRIQTQLGKSFAAKYERILGCFRRAFDAGLAAGEFRNASADELALKLAGIFNAVLAAELRRPKRRTAEEIAAVVLRLFFEPAAGGSRPRRRMGTTRRVPSLRNQHGTTRRAPAR